jgi:hypothetical protein
MLLRFDPVISWRMLSPNALHNLSVAVSGCNVYGPDEIKDLLFNESSASRASCRVRSTRNAKATLKLPERNWAHPYYIFRRRFPKMPHEYGIL